MYEKLKIFFIGVGAVLIAVAGLTIGIITGRNRKASGHGQSDVDKNNTDIRSQLDLDRRRAAEAKRIMEESERIAQGMDINIGSGQQSADRTGAIISDTRKSVSEIFAAAESKD